MDNQIVDSQQLRLRVKESRDLHPHHWESSRKLMAQESLSTLLPTLIESIQQAAIAPRLQQSLIDAVQQFGKQVKTKLLHETLKELTGLPPSKAIRALLVWGVLSPGDTDPRTPARFSGEELESRLREVRNPYDILLDTEAPSLLDIGAGDLTFERELVDHYLPQLRSRGVKLRLHAFDRLMPGSKVGGVYHKNPDHERYLKQFPKEDLNYRFWGDMDVAEFRHATGALSHYTICSCHAPANPTFAYEPTRVDVTFIQQNLEATRGHFRPGRFEGESVLEVSHRNKIMTFPSWKFNVVGPLTLLECMGQRGQVSVLSAIDDEVFWEILCQVLDGDHFRPRNQIFTKENIPDIFGSVYKTLSALAIGERVELSQIATLRDSIPVGAEGLTETAKPLRLRYVEIRRGAIWDGIPSSFTASQFSHMREESPPWWIIFVPHV